MGTKNELTKRLKSQRELGKEILSDVSAAVKDAVSGNPEAILKAAAEKHKMGSIFIYRKTPTGRMGLFHEREGVELASIDPLELESLCATEGGGGTYTVKIKVPKGEPITFGPYEVIGRPREEAKSVSDANPNPYTLAAALGGLPSPAGATSKVRGGEGEKSDGPQMASQMLEMMQKYQAELADHQQSAGDRQMAMMTQMMMQQQASSDRLMQILVTAMAPKQHEPSGVSEETRMLREELRRLQEKEQQAKLDAIAQRIEDTRHATLLEALKAGQAQPQSNGMPELLGHVFTAQQNSTAQNTELLKAMMQMSADRPTQSDQISAILSSMIGATSTNIELLSKAAQNGLLGGTDSPLKDAFVRSMETVVEGLPELLKGIAGVQLAKHGGMAQAQYAQEEYEDEEESYEMPAPTPQPLPTNKPPVHALPPKDAAAPTGPMGGLQAPEPSAPPVPEMPEVTQEQYDAIARRALTDDEVQTMMRDKAMTTIVAKIQNGVSAKEISARVWAHAQSPNRIAAKWFADPEIICQQVVFMMQVGDQERAVELIQDMKAFHAHLEAGKDPNAWPDTDYRPVKGKPATPVPVAEEQEESPEPEEVDEPDVEEAETEDEPTEEDEAPEVDAHE